MFLTSEIDCLGACEVARSNLKTSQGKMKARYDNHVIDRKFKPGDKVLALLPIPGRPLQARYFGPYTIDKKTSDLNYIINTPGRRKNKQMCHVNMLKEYFDRDSSISKPITVVNTVPQESNVFEPQVNLTLLINLILVRLNLRILIF